MTGRSIFSLVHAINNRYAEGGGLWLPIFQRDYFWDEDKVVVFFDSLLRQFPLFSFLIWETKGNVCYKRFIKNLQEYGSAEYQDAHLECSDSPYRNLVLDGHQRLQSLYLGVYGTINGKKLHFDLCSDEAQNGLERFKFLESTQERWLWVTMEDLIFHKESIETRVVEWAEYRSGTQSFQSRYSQVRQNIKKVEKVFFSENSALYQAVHGDGEVPITDSTAAEMFVLANLGSSNLGKLEVLFSFLCMEWPDAKGVLESFLNEINDDNHFRFTRKFILKLALILLGYGTKYDSSTLYVGRARKEIISNWQKIVVSLKFVKEEIIRTTQLRPGANTEFYDALIPLIYAYYHYPKKWGKAEFIPKFLAHSFYGDIFASRSDDVLEKIIESIDHEEGFRSTSIYSQIDDLNYQKNQYQFGRSLVL